jgi:hypothetical protein
MQKQGNFFQRKAKRITGLEKKEAVIEGFDIFNSFKTLTAKPSSSDVFDIYKKSETLITKTASSEFLMSIIFIICAIIFGFIFFYTNINTNGITRPTMFVGYCVWTWIAMLCAILLLRILGKFLAMLWRKYSYNNH